MFLYTTNQYPMNTIGKNIAKSIELNNKFYPQIHYNIYEFYTRMSNLVDIKGIKSTHFLEY